MDSDFDLRGNPNLKDFVRVWQRLGGEVTKPKGTGDYLFSHPRLIGFRRANARRKSTPRELLKWHRKLVTLIRKGSNEPDEFGGDA